MVSVDFSGCECSIDLTKVESNTEQTTRNSWSCQLHTRPAWIISTRSSHTAIWPLAPTGVLCGILYTADWRSGSSFSGGDIMARAHPWRGWKTNISGKFVKAGREMAGFHQNLGVHKHVELQALQPGLARPFSTRYPISFFVAFPLADSGTDAA